MIAYIQETLRAGGVADEDMVVIPHEETAALLVRVRGDDYRARRQPAADPLLRPIWTWSTPGPRTGSAARSPWSRRTATFFGRGVLDNKTGVTSMMSTILRLRADGVTPRTTLVFAFIGDEETTFGTTRLVAAHHWVRGARYAINTDAGGGMLAPDGQPLVYLVQGAEKTFASFRLTVTNPGGHSSRPRDDNAIYDLARALLRVEAISFPGHGQRAHPRLSRHARPDRAGRGRADADPLRRQPAGRRGRRGATPRARISSAPRGRPASPPCSTPAMPRTRCRSAPRRWSIAASSRASSPRRCARRWSPRSATRRCASRRWATRNSSPVSEPRCRRRWTPIAASIHAPLSRRADLALSGIGRHRRADLPQRRHPDLGDLGHVHQARRDVRARPQRAACRWRASTPAIEHIHDLALALGAGR